jgi:hypothetical protein
MKDEETLFDELARILASPMPRRRAFGRIFGGLAAAALSTVVGPRAGWAQGAPNQCQKDSDCSGSGSYCCNKRICCTTGQVCCGSGSTSICCPTGNSCCGNGANTICCKPGEVCTGNVSHFTCKMASPPM